MNRYNWVSNRLCAEIVFVAYRLLRGFGDWLHTNSLTTDFSALWLILACCLELRLLTKEILGICLLDLPSKDFDFLFCEFLAHGQLVHFFNVLCFCCSGDFLVIIDTLFVIGMESLDVILQHRDLLLESFYLH